MAKIIVEAPPVTGELSPLLSQALRTTGSKRGRSLDHH
jgi:hypothetical protein